MKKILGKALSVSLFLLAFADVAYAVPPPDFLFNLGSQVAQVFSVVVLFLSAALSVSYKFIKTKLILMKSNRIVFWAISTVVILLVAGGSAYLYSDFKQKAEYEDWLNASQEYEELSVEKGEFEINEKIERGDPKKAEKIKRLKSIDKLALNEEPKLSEQQSNLKFISAIENPDNDLIIAFIEKYYAAIANGNYEEAYYMSKKSVSLETFKGWYKNTTKVTLDDLVRIDNDTSSLELTLYEGNSYTRYGVVLTLKFANNGPLEIANSTVKTLSEGTLAEKGNTEGTFTVNTTDFKENNKNKSLSVSNKEFKKIINSDASDYIVLDAREDLEHENGYFPGSLHIRFADLKAGRWIELPDDKIIYVFCWSGIRGKEVAEFLREKNLIASYVENGANGWVEFGGKWLGNIKFGEKYTDEKYKKIFSTSQVRDKVENGVFLVDSREPWKFEDSHIAGSVNIPIMHTPTESLAETFAQVPANSTVITICDGYVNCFDAKITAVELEERGHVFLGRYNKPWEYE